MINNESLFNISLETKKIWNYSQIQVRKICFSFQVFIHAFNDSVKNGSGN